MMALFVDKGPKPKPGMVEQNIAVTGAFTDAARCIGAESLVKFIFASVINEADSRNVSCPARLIEFACPESSIISWHRMESEGAPRK